MVVNIVALILLIVVLIYIQCRFGDSKRINLIRIFLFLFYVFVLLSFTLINRDTFERAMYDLIPFGSYIALVELPWYGWGEYILRAIIGNVLLFVPLGLLLGNVFINKHMFLKIAIVAFLSSVAIEITQIIFLVGTFEVDDLINNILGALIGCSVVQVASRKDIKFTELIRILWPTVVFTSVIAVISLLAIIKDI